MFLFFSDVQKVIRKVGVRIFKRKCLALELGFFLADNTIFHVFAHRFTLVLVP